MLTPEQERLLCAALPHVAFDGWSRAALARAAKEAGFSAGVDQIIFPNPIDAVAAYSRWLDAQMDAVVDEAFTRLRIPDKIHALICARTTALQAHVEASRAARRKLLLPAHLGKATALLFATVDRMWRLSDVRDDGFSWYTRRASLAYAVAACTQYGLSDEGQAPEALSQFASRRLSEIAAVGKLRRSMGLLRKSLGSGSFFFSHSFKTHLHLFFQF